MLDRSATSGQPEYSPYDAGIFCMPASVCHSQAANFFEKWMLVVSTQTLPEAASLTSPDAQLRAAYLTQQSPFTARHGEIHVARPFAFGFGVPHHELAHIQRTQLLQRFGHTAWLPRCCA